MSTDQTPPTVNSTNPSNTAANVSLSTNITVSFSEAMNASTISATTFTLKQGTTAVAGTVSYSSNPGATFNPTDPLLPNTIYTAEIMTGAEDLAGNALEADVTWSFTTGTSTDATPPTVASTVPQGGAANVATNATITATFNEAIDPATVTTSTFLLVHGTTSTSGTVSYSGNTATFTPSSALASNTVYTATLTTAVADLSGNVLIQAYVWTFTTVTATDVTRPTIISTAPANAAANVAVSANVSATFSEAMNAATISTSTFTLMRGATAVAGAVSYAGTTATFNPTNNLAVNSTYTARISTGVTDAAGNAILLAHAWTFTTSIY